MRSLGSLVVGGVVALAALGQSERRAAAAPMSTSPEQAYDLGEIPSARAMGMGGALDAIGVSTSALYLNPANMPLARVYHFEGLSAYMPEARRQTYALGVVDSMTSQLAGGMALAWQTLDPDGLHRSWTDVRAALAYPLLSNHLSFGLTGRWLRITQNPAAGPFAASPASGGTSGSPIFNEVTFDAGATLAVLDGLRIAVVGHNLTYTKTALAPLTAGAGIGYTAQVFSIEADGQFDFTTWDNTRGRLMIGGELFLADHIAIRAGWRYDWGTYLNTPSLGLGYVDPHWSVELAARHDIVAEHASTWIVLSLRYFYDPSAPTSSSPDPFSGL